jgi:hypothetical protein
MARRGYVAGKRPNTPENLVAFLINPQAVSPGSAMPALGLTQAEARDAAAYLYTIGEAPAVPAGMPLARRGRHAAGAAHPPPQHGRRLSSPHRRAAAPGTAPPGTARRWMA